MVVVSCRVNALVLYVLQWWNPNGFGLTGLGPSINLCFVRYSPQWEDPKGIWLMNGGLKWLCSDYLLWTWLPKKKLRQWRCPLGCPKLDHPSQILVAHFSLFFDVFPPPKKNVRTPSLSPSVRFFGLALSGHVMIRESLACPWVPPLIGSGWFLEYELLF